VIELPHCGGALLGQTIAGGTERDAVGPYPIFACRDWSGLSADLDALADRFVCAYAVTDPFGATSAEKLARAFPDLCYAYKQHFVADLSQPARLDRRQPSSSQHSQGAQARRSASTAR
jgi:hypothetical protein